MISEEYLKLTLEAILFAAGEPVTLERLVQLLNETMHPNKLPPLEVKNALKKLGEDYQDRSLELKEIASGYCFRVKPNYNAVVVKLWNEPPPKYSKALLETLAVIAHRQPITRAEIEEIRGVAVHTYIIRTLVDYEWIRVVGSREVPGRPNLFETTRAFLDHFNLKSLADLPQVLT